ncbi:MAG: hypothetical protein MJ078_02920 [Clostridia bacterium]|nr:hypothetical protein [Clostridia bacterium]
MKKVLTLALALLLTVGCIFSASAAEKDFVKSIGNKSAPTVIEVNDPAVPKDDPNEKIVAVLLDKDDVITDGVKETELVIVPYDENDQQNKKKQEELKKVYDQIDQKGIDALLDKETKKSIKNDAINLNDMLVGELFNLELIGAEVSPDNKLKVTVDCSSVSAKEDVVIFVVDNEGKWSRVPPENITIGLDGKMVIVFEEAGNVAMLVQGENYSPLKPLYGLWWWPYFVAGCVCGSVLTIGIYCLVKFIKKKGGEPEEAVQGK